MRSSVVCSRIATAVVVVSLATACASDKNEQLVTKGTTASSQSVIAGPTLQDHWHAAYGVWLCDHFSDDLLEAGPDEVGIHTHDDGLIHVHPLTEGAAGANATLGRFTDQVALGLDDDHVTMPTGEIYSTGDDCEGAAGVVRVIEWPSAGRSTEATVHDVDLRDVRLRHGAAYTIAFMSPAVDPEDLLPLTVQMLGSLEGDLPEPAVDSTITIPTSPTSGPQQGCGGVGPEATVATSTVDALQFRPVLRVMQPGTCDADGLLADEDGQLYALGPPLPTGLIERAEAILAQDDEWVLHVILNEGRPGIDDLNDLAGLCSPPSEKCPSGQVAVVVDGAVVSAPAIMASEFERDQIQVAGGFTEREAKALAAQLN